MDTSMSNTNHSTTARRRLKVLLVTLAVIISIPLGLFGIWFIINSKDEPLKPEVVAALGARHDTVASQDNLFFAILAFDSKDDSDINQQGQNLYAEYLKKVGTIQIYNLNHYGQGEKSKLGQTSVFDKLASFTRQPFIGDRDQLCGARIQREACFERAVAHTQELKKLVAGNQLLLDRYEGVAKYTHFQNPLKLTIYSSLPSWAPFIDGKRLFLSDIALDVASGKADMGIEELDSDVVFTRRLLAQPDILLLDKMILVASFRDSLKLVSDLTRSGKLNDAQYKKLGSVLAPFSEDERSLAGSIVREFSSYASTIHDLKDQTNSAHLLSSEDSLKEKWFGQLENTSSSTMHR